MKKLFLALLSLVTTSCGFIQYSVQDVVDLGFRSTLYLQTDGGHCSAFAIDYDLVITAAHCVDLPNVSMKYGNTVVFGEVLLDDDETDIAIIHTVERIPGVLPLLVNDGELKPGERLIGIGYPFYAGERVTFNIGYYLGTDGDVLIATDVCYRGSSGGAVLDEYGRVVGVCSRIGPMIDFYGEGLHHSHKDLNILVSIKKVKEMIK